MKLYRRFGGNHFFHNRRNVVLRPVALMSIALMFAACTKSIDVPREQFDSAANAESAHHKITLTDGTSYIVNEFSVTDSTVVIEKLNGGDLRYRKAELPIVVSLGKIQSISKLETRKGPVTAILVGGALVIGFMAWIGSEDWPAMD